MARLFTGLETIDNWSPLDGVPAPEFVPLQWTGPHVATRLADAWRVLSRQPWKSPYPRMYGHWWPSYRVEWTDVLAMIEADELENMQREQNRVRVLPSARAITQMECAIMWPMEYLADSEQVRIVNVCAKVASYDGDLDRVARLKGFNADEWRAVHWQCCDAIADRLIDDRVMVF